MREPAVSEIVGSLALALVFVGLAGVVLAILLSQYPPDVMPDSTFEISRNYEDVITIRPTGGDPLKWGEYEILIRETAENQQVDITPWFSENTTYPGRNTTYPGNILTYPGGNVETVTVVYVSPRTGAKYLLITQNLSR